MEISNEFQQLILISILLIVPKVFLRWKIPVGITCLFFGAGTGLVFAALQDDALISMLSKIGITSLFLFAGMEVDLEELGKNKGFLLKHVIKNTFLMAVIAFLLSGGLQINYQASLVLTLGLMTPSAGFIMDSMKEHILTPEQEYWIKNKAISKEIAAVILLFFVLQSDDEVQLSISFVSHLAIIFLLPLAFRIFLRMIAPFAPNSEVTFLVLMALICGVLSKELGTYYLVGAFIVGITAGRFRHFIGKENEEKIINPLFLFASFFIPFYFFKAGLTLPHGILSTKGLIIGVIFSLIFIPIRIGAIFLSLKVFRPEIWKDRVPISLSLTPTLIFGLVMAGLLTSRLNVSLEISSALIVYTLISSIIPSLFISSKPPKDYGNQTLSKKINDIDKDS